MHQSEVRLSTRAAQTQRCIFDSSTRRIVESRTLCCGARYFQIYGHFARIITLSYTPLTLLASVLQLARFTITSRKTCAVTRATSKARLRATIRSR